jgi:hypothetical protein
VSDAGPDRDAGAAAGATPAAAPGESRVPESGGIPFAPVKPRGPLDELGAMLIAFIPGAFIVAATFFLYQDAVGRQYAAISAVCESEAGRVQEEMSRALDQRALALERLAAERAEDADAWQADAAALAGGPLQVRAVLEFDSTLALGRVVPADARFMSALDPKDDESRRIALRVATGTLGREAVVVSTAPLT